MAIDYAIEFDCEPKRQFTRDGILERLKERQRAEEVIEWFRAAGDERPPAEMGFEFTRSTPDDLETRQLIVVQDLLDHAATLNSYRHHCGGCPANCAGASFGCMGFIQYPISATVESWLLDRLPVPDEPLVWLLLRQGIRRFGYDGSTVKALRESDHRLDSDDRRYFELPVAPQRRLGELEIDGDQAFEMIFGVGNRIIPNHAGVLLLFFGAINRDLEAAEIQDISSPDPAIRERLAFKMDDDTHADAGVRDMITFFRAMYLAWRLNVTLYVDA